MHLRETFGALGFEVHPQPFPASLLPGRFAFPAVGLALFAASAAAILALLEGNRGGALFALGGGALLVAIIGLGAATATDRWRAGRVELANLWITWPGGTPRWLLVAHLDSKSQFVPLSMRASAAGGAALTWGALLLLALVGGPISAQPALLAFLAITAAASGIPMLLSGSANASPGALDNASGVATLLGVAHEQRGARDIAILVTDGEELGLAGSRAFARDLPPLEGVINIDGVDDEGGFYILDRFGLRREKPPSPPVRALLAAAPASETWVHRRRVPFGLVLDHMSFARSGVPALTLMRGTFRSLARVHRPGDDIAHLRGDGVRDAVRLVCAALRELRGEHGRSSQADAPSGQP